MVRAQGRMGAHSQDNGEASPALRTGTRDAASGIQIDPGPQQGRPCMGQRRFTRPLHDPDEIIFGPLPSLGADPGPHSRLFACRLQEELLWRTAWAQQKYSSLFLNYPYGLWFLLHSPEKRL